MYDSRQCTGIKILKVFPAGHGCAVTGRLFCLLPPAPQCEFKYLSLGLLIKLAYPATKYQCTPLRVQELVADRTPLAQEGDGGAEGGVEVGGGGAGQVPTGQTVSERRRGSVTYCFTGTLPDLLGVKARSSLVYTQPWISAWNMSTSSQPISHRGGAVWAADTSRFPRTMRPIPHARPTSQTGAAETDADRGTLLLHWATELSLPLGPSSRDRPLTRGPLSEEMEYYVSQNSVLISRQICF